MRVEPISLIRFHWQRPWESWRWLLNEIPMQANPSTAHMFIVNPLRGGGVLSLFSTHPPMEERIARLEEMARTGRF